MDALDLLSAHHNRVRGLFGRFTDAQHEDDTAEQVALAAKIVDELDAHATVEEEVFYPSVRELSAAIGGSVDGGLEEHRLTRTIVGEIRSLEAGSDRWVARVEVLMEVVEHHTDEEEKELFPKVRSLTDPSSREAVGEKMEARMAEIGEFTATDNRGRRVAELPYG